MKAIIVNPHSSRAKAASVWQEIRSEVLSRLGGAQEFLTASLGDATRFASEVAHNHNQYAGHASNRIYDLHNTHRLGSDVVFPTTKPLKVKAVLPFLFPPIGNFFVVAG